MSMSYQKFHEEFSKTTDGVLRGSALLALSSVLFFGIARMFRIGPGEISGAFYWTMFAGTCALCLVTFLVAWYFLIQPVIRLEQILNTGPAWGNGKKMFLFGTTLVLIFIFFAGSLGMLYVNLQPLLPNK